MNNNFTLENTTFWSFPERGNWSTHNSRFRGNFAPQIPRNIILKYSNEGDTVLDPMVGSGTTIIECKLLNRNGIGIDINTKNVEIATKLLDFNTDNSSHQEIYKGDVRNLEKINNDSIDLVCTHPPYLNIIKYSDGMLDGDLSNISSPKEFCDELEKGINELYRVLKPNHYCALLVGDTRKSRHYVPLSYMTMHKFLKNGFILKEDIIKIQHNCKTTPKWQNQSKKYDFYLIMHEHLFIFRKPHHKEDLSRFRWSRIPPGDHTITD